MQDNKWKEWDGIQSTHRKEKEGKQGRTKTATDRKPQMQQTGEKWWRSSDLLTVYLNFCVYLWTNPLTNDHFKHWCNPLPPYQTCSSLAVTALCMYNQQIRLTMFSWWPQFNNKHAHIMALTAVVTVDVNKVSWEENTTLTQQLHAFFVFFLHYYNHSGDTATNTCTKKFPAKNLH